MTGADARRGDIVRNLTTGHTGIVTGSSQFGRLIVKIRTNGQTTVKWERWNVEVVAQFEGTT
jgi:hypothetical protein